jgi:hypothetical protein
MLRQAAALFLAVAASAAPVPQSTTTPPPAAIVVHQDKVTAILERVPVTTVLTTIVEQTGAELRGDVPAPHDVTLELHDAPLEEALERILGEQSFTLTYEADGRLKRIVLGGTASPASGPSGPAAGASTPGAPSPEVADATRRVAEFVQSDRTVTVDGHLAEALGTGTTTFQQVLAAALRHEDPRVRAEARRAAIKSLVADPEVRMAFATTIDSLSDTALVHALRTAGGPDAEELATALGRHGRSPVLARRMQRALPQLRAPADDR